MEFIFHEKQEGSLCAQHCLNAILQGPYFTPMDLAELAQKLDESERQHMAEGGFTSDEYQQFMKQPSSNYDDSGFFSIQVLQEALKVWNLDLLPFNSSEPICVQARQDPRSQKAFICNFKEHWFTVRHMGNQWFNLNSLLTGPELLSDTFLSLFLRQLQHEGYSIFVLSGELPPCEADDVLRLMPAVQPIKPKLLSEAAKSAKASSLSSHDDDELQNALEASRHLDEDDDKTLKEALQLSMMEYQPTLESEFKHEQRSTKVEVPVNVEQLRQQRLAFFERGTQRGTTSEQIEATEENVSTTLPSSDDIPEEMLLEMAIKMSMENSV